MIKAAKEDVASHWYRKVDGDVKAYHSVPYAGIRGKKGERRATSLRDARKVNALPSVTQILKILHKEMLVNYKINKALESVMRLTQEASESNEDYLARVFKDSKTHSSEAALTGERLHEIASQIILPDHHFSGLDLYNPDETLGNGSKASCIVSPMTEKLNKWTGGESTDPEFSEFSIFNEKIGYAGCCDGLIYLDTSDDEIKEKLSAAGHDELLNRGLIIAMMDIKSRGGATKKPPIYETDLLQLAAYLHGVNETPNRGFNATSESIPVANILVSTDPRASWDTEIIIHPKEEVDKSWQAFKSLVKVWQFLKNYNPTITK